MSSRDYRCQNSCEQVGVGRDVEGFGPWDAGFSAAFRAGRGLEGGATVDREWEAA
jgi:hypothetical protein